MAIQPTQKFSDNHSPEYDRAKLRVLRDLHGRNVGKSVVHDVIMSTIRDGHYRAAVLSSPVVRSQNELAARQRRSALDAIEHVKRAKKEQQQRQRALDDINGVARKPTMRERVVALFRAAATPTATRPVVAPARAAAAVAREEAVARSNAAMARVCAELDAPMSEEAKSGMLYDQLTTQRERVFDELAAQRNTPGDVARNTRKALSMRLREIDAKLAKLAPRTTRSADRADAEASALAIVNQSTSGIR